MTFETSIFINCPFDTEYRALLEPLLFLVMHEGLTPLIAETKSSGDVRVNEIKALIEKAKYSIHDLSRSKAKKAGELPRFNMPFEMGLDLGCQHFGRKKMRDKQCLVLHHERHTYAAILSDIGGQDIKAHENNPQKLIEVVRDWLSAVLDQHLTAPGRIWDSYLEFRQDLNEQLTEEGFTVPQIKSMTFSSYIRLAKKWISAL